MFDLRSHKKELSISEFTCSRDNLIIRGTEYRPQGESLPIAIVSHGFMAFQDTVRHYTEKLAELGYVSYCFDFCGGCVVRGKSDGKTTEMSVLTEISDLEAVIEYARNRPYGNSREIVLMGCSQGGLVSAMTASRLNSQISKLILLYPAFCIPDDARAGKMMFAKFDPDNIPDTINCGPMKLGKCYVEDVINLDPYQETKGFQGDVFIIHGTKDRIVDMEYIKKAYHTYMEETENKRIDRSVIFHKIEKGGHGFSKKHDVIAMEHIEHFLEASREDKRI